MNTSATDFRNPIVIRKKGMSALTKELGVVGATCFMRQFEMGSGDYTAERDTLLKDVSLDEIIKAVKTSE